MQDKHKSDFVNVVARVRPNLDDLSVEDGLQITTDPPGISILDRQQHYLLDHVFDQNANQETIYENTVRHLVDKLLQGYNCTVFAYGQTGSGKTYTMGTNGTDINNFCESGIIIRTIQDIMNRGNLNVETGISVSFYEIYNEKVYDLLSEHEMDKHGPLKVKGFQISGLTKKPVSNFYDGCDYLKRGGEKRHRGETKQNVTSSRSHAILTVYVNVKHENSEFNVKLNLVDLAGSECVKRTCTEGSQFQEGVNINLGLLSIGQVISALSKPTSNTHIPYRESVITTVLKDSLNKNNYITLLACVSANVMDLTDTIQTLEFAQRAKKLKNKPELSVIIDQNRPPNTPAAPHHLLSVRKKLPSAHRSVLSFRTPLKRPPAYTTSTLFNSAARPITNYLSTHNARPIRAVKCQQPLPLPRTIKTTPSCENVNMSEIVPMCSSSFMSNLNGDNSVVSANQLSSMSSVVSSCTDATILSPIIRSYLESISETIHNNAMTKLDQAIQKKFETLSRTTSENLNMRRVLQITSTERIQEGNSKNMSTLKSDASPVRKHYSAFVENLTPNRKSMRQKLFTSPEGTTSTLSDSAIFKVPKPLPRKRKLAPETTVNGTELKMASPMKRRRSVRLQAKEPRSMYVSSMTSSSSNKHSSSCDLNENDIPVSNSRKSGRLSIKKPNKSPKLTRKNQTKSKIAPIPAPRRKVASVAHYNRILHILNNGTEKKLMELPTVGIKTANQFYYYRSINGKFNKISDLAAMPWKGTGYQRFLEANFLDVET